MPTHESSASIRLEVDFRPWLETLKNAGWTDELGVELDALLESQFAETQARVHVVTGSLRLSGKKDSGYDTGSEEWSGSIQYGGPAPGGVHDPVNYAVYEWGRGGTHDFMFPIDNPHKMQSDYKDVLMDHFRRAVSNG